jgi:hypothetical protein
MGKPDKSKITCKKKFVNDTVLFIGGDIYMEYVWINK